MRRPASRSRMALLSTALLPVVLACTTTVDLRYGSRSGAAAPATHSRISVGEFADARETEATHLGSIRSGVGSRMKILVLEKPASEVVRAAFQDGLRQRGVLAEDGRGATLLSGTIEKLDCNQYSNREAHVILRVRAERGGRVLLDDVFQKDLVEGGGLGGPFGSVEGLRLLSERALREVVDEALADDRLQAGS